MEQLAIQYRNIANLKPQARNPRTHTKRQIRQVAASIKEFGFVNPVLIDAENRIIAGHGRIEAAKLAGMTEVPTVKVDHLSPAQLRAYVIADNKLAENAGWDRELLVLELKELEITFKFDLTLTGFETAEIDLLYGTDGVSDSTADEIPETNRSKAAVSQPGDLWRIGAHVLLCGDATKPETYARLLGGETAQLVFTDPPYNVRIGGNVSGLGNVKHREFQMASGEMSKADFTSFLKRVFHNLAQHSADGALQYICMDWRHMEEVLEAAKAPYTRLENLCVWNKTNGGMGSFYRSKHELVFVFKNGSAPHINNVDLGSHGRYRTNVWDYAGANTFGKDRDESLAMHPTVKPVALVADAILDASDRGAAVLDAFAGSGTTLVAAEKTGRRGFGIELDPYYVDTIIARMSKLFGFEAELVDAGFNYQAAQKRRTDEAWEHALN